METSENISIDLGAGWDNLSDLSDLATWDELKHPKMT